MKNIKIYELNKEEFAQLKSYMKQFPKLEEYFFDGTDNSYINQSTNHIRWMNNNKEWNWDMECGEFLDTCECMDSLCCEDEDAMITFLDYAGRDQGQHFEDAYCGKYDSETAYAEELIDDCYDLENRMGNLHFYFNYEAFARDLFITDNYYSDGYVFRTNW